MELIVKLFGEDKNLTTLNMSLRAVMVYLILLLLIRISGTRTLAKKTAFDNIIVITVGALLSRVIVGASEFVPTVTAGFSLVVAHRCLAWISLRHPWLDKWIKGSRRLLYKNGIIHHQNLVKSLMSEEDLLESVRTGSNIDTLEKIEEARLERTGEVSIIKNKFITLGS
ncbi:hypothetical protein TH53_09825 [Pedobacter lusitanus]|uniref:YetF C-terminal domain-containing protein n=1 Tax=Pedobacter lusitanus TaxID=1503925 RepID=A0A0D0F712_9SPHI|nr:YetF domain-containing protein [Pedobacter lusitanus]KIO77358.1 hypothetical protein TH53_09825 [Pedobacter lusitanus]